MLYFKTQTNQIGYLASEDLLPQGSTLISYQELEDIKNPPNLNAEKAQKVQEIENQRDKVCTQNVQALSRVWQADKRSQELVGQSITLAQAGLPLPATWRDYNNNDMTITSINDLLAIGGAMATQTQSAYSTSWARKASINTATTIQGIRSIIW